MGWLIVKEQGHLATSDAGEIERTASRFFVAVADAPTTPTAAETASAGGVTVPKVKAAHPNDASRLLRKITVRPDEESPATVFRIQLDYSNLAEGSENNLSEDPSDWPDEMVWSFLDRKEPYFIDNSEEPKPVTNSAGDPFQELLERDAGTIALQVRRTALYVGNGAYDPVVAIDYCNVVNSDTFTIDGKKIKAGQAKIRAWVAGGVRVINGKNYRDLEWYMDFKEDWDVKIADRGMNQIELFSGTGKTTPIMNIKPPSKVEHPWPLNGQGRAKQNSTDKPEELTFRPYKRKPFGRFLFK